MQTFHIGTKILSGTGALSALGELGIQRLFLVTDPYFTKNGTAGAVAEAAGAQAVEIFDGIAPDPTVELAARGTARVQEFQPDTIVALGGGSAMDCAKAMACFSGRDIRFIAVPTTSGSGSEVTDFAILTHNGVKHPLVDEKLQPDMAILDDSLLQELPPSLIADTGFDVLAHALEAYAATGAGAFSDALAKAAFCTAFAELPASFAGDRQVRLSLHNAATMAGMAFSQAGLGLCHAMAHSLGGLFHIPHGRLNAILLPAVLEHNAPKASGKYAALARAAGLGSSADTLAVRNLKNSLVRLRSELKLPATLAQAGIDPRLVREQADPVTKAVLADPCCSTNPVPVEAFAVQQLLEAVTGRG